ncbi:DUF1753-domain-containing protein [Punctularia strigosozonata HHB-11173 SS5]|uniref:DUF1753-domain-containing protein n=1 Tax=Punctularia strigosozonata (strain HHB-11173) TaxID=741275 RepID=UPI0004417B15|nr:DUF1753-domain-containing protein [Punctularia strigosozonata HHB-11173 SS5]EIN09653.1 DUF1753-domain-containing protein [Punctularia strigosozonata HHB-11173 SS5]
MLRPEWKPRPASSFLGCLDLKIGVTVALLFALLNKVAGVYGLIAALTGAGGSFAQISLYVYSVFGLVVLAWGLRAVTEEDAKRSLYFAHMFFADHVLSTMWTVFFAVTYWVYTPHDGRRQASSAAQEEIMNGGMNNRPPMSDVERETAARMIWNQEKGSAAALITIGWLSKFYFALLIYSYAMHLRRGSYRSLPHSRPNPATTGVYAALGDDEEDVEIEEFYRVPTRTPAGNSISNFGDLSTTSGRLQKQASRNPSSKSLGDDAVDEVLFDEDEADRHSRLASAEGSTSKSSSEDEPPAGVGAGHDRSRTARAWMAPVPGAR